MNQPNKKYTAWILLSILILSIIATSTHVVFREPFETYAYEELEERTIPEHSDELIAPLIVKALESEGKDAKEFIEVGGKENFDYINGRLFDNSEVIYKDWYQYHDTSLKYAVNVKGNQKTFTNMNKDQKAKHVDDYLWYVSFAFDEKGNPSILKSSKNIAQSDYLARLDTVNINFRYDCYGYNEEIGGFDDVNPYEVNDEVKITGDFGGLKNVEITLAVEKNIPLSDYLLSNNGNASPYANLIMISAFVFIGLLVIVAIVSFFLPKRYAKESAGIRKLLNTPIELLVIMAGCFYLGGFFVYDSTYEFYQYSYYATVQQWRVWVELLFGLFLCAYNFLAILYVYVVVNHLKQMGDEGFIDYFKNHSLLVKAPIYFYRKITSVDIHDKGARYLTIFAIVNFLFMFFVIRRYQYSYHSPLLFALIVNGIIFIIALSIYHKIQKNYQDMRNSLTDIAQGNFSEPEVHDLGIYESMNESIEEIRVGFKEAVEKEVKSQRMKTELITNVSHDLKTPLTSIVSYVDLLKNSATTEEEKKQYLETLETNSKRLKYLIEDLFEVSKASAGAVVLNLTKVDVNELLKQLLVEYEDRLQMRSLDIRYQTPVEKVYANLDPQKTYRIFANLLGNISKYAMPNSRVYIDVEVKDKVIITFKNISEHEIHFKADEIVERFTRGDASRNSEGSGLGLSIASSFTQLQKGTFDISLDADLFKVTVMFPLLKETVDEIKNG